jgi:hypothetical protein
MTLDSRPSEALGRQSCGSSSSERRAQPVDREIAQAGAPAKEPGYGKVVPYIELAPANVIGPCTEISKGACLDQGSY